MLNEPREALWRNGRILEGDASGGLCARSVPCQPWHTLITACGTEHHTVKNATKLAAAKQITFRCFVRRPLHLTVGQFDILATPTNCDIMRLRQITFPSSFRMRRLT